MSTAVLNNAVNITHQKDMSLKERTQNTNSFFFLAEPMACCHSQARDHTHVRAVTGAAAVTVLDP